MSQTILVKGNNGPSLALFCFFAQTLCHGKCHLDICDPQGAVVGRIGSTQFAVQFTFLASSADFDQTFEMGRQRCLETRKKEKHNDMEISFIYPHTWD